MLINRNRNQTPTPHNDGPAVFCRHISLKSFEYHSSSVRRYSLMGTMCRTAQSGLQHYPPARCACVFNINKCDRSVCAYMIISYRSPSFKSVIRPMQINAHNMSRTEQQEQRQIPDSDLFRLINCNWLVHRRGPKQTRARRLDVFSGWHVCHRQILRTQIESPLPPPRRPHAAAISTFQRSVIK